jgi:hypothetical protein
LHAAVAVAVGAFGLAVMGMIHALPTGPVARWLVALVAWPAFTAVPAFLVALVSGMVLARASRRSA